MGGPKGVSNSGEIAENVQSKTFSQVSISGSTFQDAFKHEYMEGTAQDRGGVVHAWHVNILQPPPPFLLRVLP